MTPDHPGREARRLILDLTQAEVQRRVVNQRAATLRHGHTPGSDPTVPTRRERGRTVGMSERAIRPLDRIAREALDLLDAVRAGAVRVKQADRRLVQRKAARSRPAPCALGDVSHTNGDGASPQPRSSSGTATGTVHALIEVALDLSGRWPGWVAYPVQDPELNPGRGHAGVLAVREGSQDARRVEAHPGAHEELATRLDGDDDPPCRARRGRGRSGRVDGSVTTARVSPHRRTRAGGGLLRSERDRVRPFGASTWTTRPERSPHVTGRSAPIPERPHDASGAPVERHRHGRWRTPRTWGHGGRMRTRRRPAERGCADRDDERTAESPADEPTQWRDRARPWSRQPNPIVLRRHLPPLPRETLAAGSAWRGGRLSDDRAGEPTQADSRRGWSPTFGTRPSPSLRGFDMDHTAQSDHLA